MQKEIKLIAHGGYSARYPENTKQSLLEAVKFNPNLIEMDVVEHPKTGELICFRPTGLSSRTGTFSKESVLEQLQSGETFPSVKELLRRIPANIKLLLDFKQPSQELFSKIIQSSDFDLSRVVIGVRNLADFNFIKSLNSEVQTLALFADPDSYEEYARGHGVFFRLWEKDLTVERLRAIQQLGLEVWVTPGQKATATEARTAGELDEKKLSQLETLGVDAVLVNNIELANKTLREEH